MKSWRLPPCWARRSRESPWTVRPAPEREPRRTSIRRCLLPQRRLCVSARRTWRPSGGGSSVAVLADELSVTRRPLGRPADPHPQALQAAVELRGREPVRERIVAARENPLTEVHREPARLEEQPILVRHDIPA